LPDGAAVILSIAKFSSPSGKKIQDDAVTPNVLVASSSDQDDTSEEGAPPAAATSPKSDDQLNKALDLLKQKAA